MSARPVSLHIISSAESIRNMASDLLQLQEKINQLEHEYTKLLESCMELAPASKLNLKVARRYGRRMEVLCAKISALRDHRKELKNRLILWLKTAK